MANENATPVSAPTVLDQLTVADVINPSVALPVGVFGDALKKKKAKADEKLVGFAGQVLETTQRRMTALATTKAALVAELDKIKADEARVTAAAEYAQATNNVFALAAVVGMKQTACQLAAEAGLVVPANDDPIWTVVVRS